MRTRILIFTSLICFSEITFSQNSYEKAYSKLFTINDDTREVGYLHFKIQTIPEYFHLSNNESQLTDIYYSIKYKEYGTPENVTWVKIFDGQLVNDLARVYTQQWKGPFPGNRDISYKFLFELISDTIQHLDKLNITIFSTNPELDFKYCSIPAAFPFQVSAIYYNTENLVKVIEVYSGCSNIHTIYKLASSTNIVTTIGTAILEEIVIYAIKAELRNLPVYLTIKCNVCGKTETLKINDINYKNIYQCNTPGCHNRAEIRLIE
jgi:hypothetical protein